MKVEGEKEVDVCNERRIRKICVERIIENNKSDECNSN